MYKRRGPPGSPTTVTAFSSQVDLGDQKMPALAPTPPKRTRRRSKSRQEWLPMVVCVVALVTVSTFAVLFFQQQQHHQQQQRQQHQQQHDVQGSVSFLSTADQPDASFYQCPVVATQPDTATNFDKVRFQNHYLTEEAHVQELNDFVANFRTTPYDDWGQSYQNMKNGMQDWKRQTMVPHIQPGDKIYESAIGMGLNALMTLEILQQEKGNMEVSIYGNEYLVSSTTRANEFLDRILPSHVHKGNICVGDSTNISYVPSNAFDLVYTGYVLPIGNPLHFEQPDKDPYGINHGRYHELCDGNDWRDVWLRELAQRRQEDFYAAWVGEMIRIAKPGKPVIVEHVSQPKCDDREDWGGVAKSWWSIAIERYNWPIDPESIIMEDDHIYSFQRYHVFMRKNEEQVAS